jgi:DNA-binding transcriptional MerR regulator
MSRVTSRALRHYHAIGLLPPARVGGNGIRYYEREQLLQLQHIMLLRELGLGLDAITRIVHERADPVEQLSRHQRWLADERDRLDRLARTVARTIEDLKGGEKMSTDKLFEGFDAEKQARYEAELVQRYGPEVRPHIAESKRRMAEPGRADAARLADDWAAVGAALVPLIGDGARPDDPRVQEVIAGHHRWLLNFWTPNRESYTGLGHLYVDSPEFKSQLDAVDPRLAEFLRDSMAAYAVANLD